MPSSRYFVTNLPLETTEDDLRTLFEKYGPVTLVELKTKENEESILKFAFITVELSNEDAEYYLNEIKWETIRGSRVKVSIAKESFLERLKRERENEANASTTAQKPLEAEENQRTSVAFPESQQNTRRVFAEDEDLEDIPADLLITKKRAARSIQNGKIVIEESGLEPLHVIEKQKRLKHDKTTKTSATAEAKRKESLNKMKNQYDQKKNAIKEALSGVNTSISNKIKFSDSEEDEETVPKRKTDIFDTENGNEEDITDLNLNYGKKGDKLAKLRSQRQNLDARFKIDEKFVDGDDDDDELEDDQDLEDGKDEEPNEREWQLNILEQVVGYKLDKSTLAEKAARNKKMIRYDPSKTEHEKLLRQKVSDTTKDKASKEQEPEQKPAPVSQDVFYVVSDTFSQAIKTRGDGFSLLNMFGSQAVSAELEQREDNLKQLKDERILVNKLNKNPMSNVQYESSSSGEDEEENSKSKKVNKNESKQQKGKGNKKKVAIIMETFFFKANDQRLKEGTEFFKYDKLKEIAEEDYEPVRRKLNLLIKKKISKTKKNQFGAARKPLKTKKKKV